MSDDFHRYLVKLDELRVLRAEGGNRDDETEVLDEMDEIWEKLTASERADVREESWRAWPREYEGRLGVADIAKRTAFWGNPIQLAVSWKVAVAA